MTIEPIVPQAVRYPMVQHAGHHNFEKLLRCGVRLFEYPHTLLHQKVMTIDGMWTATGSSNFDDRSFETNDEITLGIQDAATAQRLDAVFEKYAPHCKELELEAWRKRGSCSRRSFPNSVVWPSWVLQRARAPHHR